VTVQGACEQTDVAPAEVRSKPGYEQRRVSVSDSSGAAISGLKQSDFSVRCGAAQCPIEFFYEINKTTPSSIVIAVDTSRSMSQKLKAIRSQLTGLLRDLNPCDEVALVAFSRHPEVVQSFTKDHALVEDKLASLHAFEETALYDGISAGLVLASKARYSSRALIVVTDGMDTVSVRNLDIVLASANRLKVPIYTIGIGDPTAAVLGGFVIDSSTLRGAVNKAELYRIASETGGLDFIVPIKGDTVKESSGAIDRIAGQLNSGYDIGFIDTSSAASPVITVPKHADCVVTLPGFPRASTPAAK